MKLFIYYREQIDRVTSRRHCKYLLPWQQQSLESWSSYPKPKVVITISFMIKKSSLQCLQKYIVYTGWYDTYMQGYFTFYHRVIWYIYAGVFYILSQGDMIHICRGILHFITGWYDTYMQGVIWYIYAGVFYILSQGDMIHICRGILHFITGWYDTYMQGYFTFYHRVIWYIYAGVFYILSQGDMIHICRGILHFITGWYDTYMQGYFTLCRGILGEELIGEELPTPAISISPKITLTEQGGRGGGGGGGLPTSKKKLKYHCICFIIVN